MGRNWVDRAFEQADKDLESGEIDVPEYNRQIRDIRLEAEEYAESRARDAYDDAIGY